MKKYVFYRLFLDEKLLSAYFIINMYNSYYGYHSMILTGLNISPIMKKERNKKSESIS